jgi:hypothetical protein
MDYEIKKKIDAFEIYVKTFFTLALYKGINLGIDKLNQLNIKYSTKYFLVIGGGEAVNYYQNNFRKNLQTHDIDIRFTTIPSNVQVESEKVDPALVDYMKITVLTVISDFLNYFYNIYRPRFDTRYGRLVEDNAGKVFQAINSNPLLHIIKYSYILEDVGGVIEGSVVDLPAITQSFVERFKYLIPNIVLDKSLDDYGNNQENFKFLSENGALLGFPINIVIQDIDSGLYYLNFGDIINDTVRMVLWSYTNLQENSSNKYSRYLKKYLSLLNTANDVLSDFDCATSDNYHIVKCFTQKSAPYDRYNKDYDELINSIDNFYDKRIESLVDEYKIVYNKLEEINHYLDYEHIISYIEGSGFSFMEYEESAIDSNSSSGDNSSNSGNDDNSESDMEDIQLEFD